jgi:hypothetical protein
VRPPYFSRIPLEKARLPGAARNVQALCCSPGELSRLGVTQPGLGQRAPGGNKMVTGWLSQRVEKLGFRIGASLYSLRKKSVLYLLLGGAAVHRCSKCIVLNPALAAEGTALAHGRLFPQAV